jgi:hypothetical protein
MEQRQGYGAVDASYTISLVFLVGIKSKLALSKDLI